jgi:hypothetical protein
MIPNQTHSHLTLSLSTLATIIGAGAAAFIAFGQTASLAPKSPASQDPQAQVLAAYHNAIASPFDEEAFKILQATIPRAGDYYVVEGDIQMTADELREYLVGFSPHATQDKSRELLVNTKPDGSLDYYRNPTQRHLTYSVDKLSFPTTQQYQLVVDAMATATADWESSCKECRITFEHNPANDAQASITTTNFVVRYFDAQGTYIAASFFPSDPPLRRYLNVDPSYFTSQFDKVGVFRHELGHILGYRHEHIRGIAGCAYEDNAWKPLTPYDPHSVMHYFCGGGGSFALELSSVDILGHRKLYAPESIPTPVASVTDQGETTRATLIVRAEGGDVSEEAAHILLVLERASLLPSTTTTIKSGDNLVQLYKTHLGLPAADEHILSLAHLLNPGLKHSDSLRVGESISIPAVQFTTYTFRLYFDRKSPTDNARAKEVEENWSQIKNSASSDVTSPDPSLSAKYAGYELRVPMSLADAKAITDEINGMQRRNIFATYSGDLPPPQFFSRVDPAKLISMIRARPSQLHVADEAYIGDLVRVPREYSCQQNPPSDLPDLVLIDQPVNHHPELEGVVDALTGESFPQPASNPDGTVALNFEEFRRERDHGTHLAGIIAAQENGYGIAGVNPHSKIQSWDWNKYIENAMDLGDRLRSVSEGQKRPIFVFASVWRSDQERYLANPMDGSRSIWIVAAGEKSDVSPRGFGFSNPTDITDRTDEYPMRLGLKDYVIEVASCTSCYDPDSSRISTDSNYSTMGYVHVAAPGDSIPSTVGNGGYAEAGGTSQAAALTAGLVSAMVRCWPDYYQNETAKLKFRLQLTSWPGLRSDQGDRAPSELRKVTGGVIDGRPALLDPSKSWLLVPNAPPGVGDEYRELKSIAWCTPTILLKRLDGVSLEPVLTEYIRGVVKVKDEWFLLAHETPEGNDQKQDQLERVGPGHLDPEAMHDALVRTDLGDFSLAEITDLILPTKIQSIRSCSESGK